MIEDDRASELLGMRVLVDEPGRSVVSMTVRDDMVNGHGIAHGGFVFALADTAFAVACNNTDDVTVAAGAEITYLQPVRSGEALTATAERRVEFGRSGIYDVRVQTEGGVTVAEFRGHSRTLRHTE